MQHLWFWKNFEEKRLGRLIKIILEFLCLYLEIYWQVYEQPARNSSIRLKLSIATILKKIHLGIARENGLKVEENFPAERRHFVPRIVIIESLYQTEETSLKKVSSFAIYLSFQFFI